MENLIEPISRLAERSPDTLLVLLALAAIGLAGFAIHVVHSVVKEKERR